VTIRRRPPDMRRTYREHQRIDLYHKQTAGMNGDHLTLTKRIARYMRDKSIVTWCKPECFTFSAMYIATASHSAGSCVNR
jgi:hypothetical protein